MAKVNELPFRGIETNYFVRPSYGVIVARCQVHELHEGHLALFRGRKARHNRVIVFLGQKPIGSTYKNPLDFETRKAMIQAKFPEFFVLPLTDAANDFVWSKRLDDKIRELADYGDVTLWRQGFVCSTLSRCLYSGGIDSAYWYKYQWNRHQG